MSALPAALRRAGLVGVALGAAGAGAATGAVAGLAAERYVVGRPLWRRTPPPAVPYGSLRGEPRVVLTEDGVVLHVEVDELDGDSGVTVIFCHGYALTCDAFHYQRLALREQAAARRLVFWDQRGHGRSGRPAAPERGWHGRRGADRAASPGRSGGSGDPGPADIDRLGRDLHRVVQETAPDGPVVLVGHSMGGMTVMALADQQPELFGGRVVGVALLSTSPGMLAEVTLGVPAAVGRVAQRVAPQLLALAGRQATLVERGRRMGGDVAYAFTRRYSFASDVSPALVEFVMEMIASTPIEVIAELFPAFAAHDKLSALDVLDGVETLLLCGDADLITPPDHTREMLARVPGAELQIVPSAGHLALLEHPNEVNRHLLGLLARATRTAEAA